MKVFQAGMLITCGAAFAAPAHAQNVDAAASPRFGIGFVASPPEMMAGGGGYVILPVLGGLGLYVDAKFDTSSPEGESDFDDSLTSREVLNERPGQKFEDDDTSWRAFDVGLVRPLNPSLMIYVGAGIAKRKAYHAYYDPDQQYGIAGHYVVAAPDESEDRINGMAGVFLRISRYFNAQFGVEAAPRGATVGVSLVLPPG